MTAMNLKQCYAALEIHERADKDRIRQAYRDLVTIWHPDQYQENPRLQEKATEKLKELNAAYATLMAHAILLDGVTIFAGVLRAIAKKLRPLFIALPIVMPDTPR